MKHRTDFEQLYIQHWEKLYAFCYKITRDEHLSQNIVQDVFTDLWERRETVYIESAANYLFRAAKNQIFKAYREKRFDTVVIDESFESYQADPEEDENDRITTLYTLLENLPEKRKEILILNKLERMDVGQIALRLDLSPQTVKNQLTSALKQLRHQASELTALLLIIGIYLTIL